MQEIVSFFPRPLGFTLKKTTETTWNLTFRWSVMGIAWTKKAVTAHLTWWLRLCHLPAEKWIMCENLLFIRKRVCRNIGLLIRKKKSLRFIQRSDGIFRYAILLRNGFKWVFMETYILSLQSLFNVKEWLPKDDSTACCGKIDKQPYLKYNLWRYISYKQLIRKWRAL